MNGELDRVKLESDLKGRINYHFDSNWMSWISNTNFDSLSIVIYYKHNGKGYFVIEEFQYQMGQWNLLTDNTKTGALD
jgi:hypothetical protein